MPGYPQCWANLGRALRERGPAGAQEFLTRLEVVERDYPQAINNHVRAIQSDCLVATGQIAQARRQRQQAIQLGTEDIAFFADEAKASLAENNPAAAIAVLDKARQLGISNDYSEAIYANALEAADNTEAALALRAAKIAQNSSDPAFYNDQAKTLAKLNRLDEALALLDQAERDGIANEVTRTIRRQLQARRRTD